MSSRKQRKSAPTASLEATKTHKKIESSWILLLNDELFSNDNFDIITVPHPGHGQPAKYCLDSKNKKVYEVVTFDEPYRSWFVGETVKSDGRVMMLSPMNPIFLVLPCLREQCINKAVPLEHLLTEKGYDKIYDYVQDLSEVADLKGSPDMKAYKYNETKTLKWLVQRVNKASIALKEKNISVRSGAVSATFVSSCIDTDTVDDEFYKKYAFGLISEYLQEDLADALEKEFDFKPDLIENLSKKRKSEADLDNATKKIRHEDDEQKENSITSPSQLSTEAKKPKQLSAKEKARQKAASGTKTISSFFTKK